VLPWSQSTNADVIRRNNLAFSRLLGDINDAITRMSETSSTAYVRVVNQNLGSLTTTSRAGDTVEQRQALERLEGLKEAAVKVVAQISGGRIAEEDTRTQAFMMIPAARAVWVYKGDVFYAWAGGVALDLVPTIFVILLTLGKPVEDEEREKDRQAARAAPPGQGQGASRRTAGSAGRRPVAGRGVPGADVPGLRPPAPRPGAGSSASGCPAS